MRIGSGTAAGRSRAGRVITTSAVLMALSLGVTVAPNATAQTDTKQTQLYQLPAGSLGTALNRFASESGMTLSFDPALVAGRQAPALNGRYTASQGLAKLLNGSGLQAVSDAGGYRLQAVPRDEESTLAPISVTGAMLRADDPVGDYVPRRSATATKTDVPLIEVPQSINITSSEQMRDRNVDTLSKAFDYAPGVYALGGSSSRDLIGTQLVSRGFNITGAQPLYLNGSKFPINSLSGGEEPYFYERIELLKGPSSILFGQAAPGGIVNLVSKRPTATPYREAGVAFDSYGSKTLKGDFAGPITADGRLGYRVTGLYRDGETMIDEIPDDRKAVQTVLEWQPTDNTSLTLLGTLQENDALYNYGLPFDGTVLDNPNGKLAPDLFVGEPGVDKFDIEKYSLGYLFEHAVNDVFTFRQSLLGYHTRTDYTYVGISRQARPDDRSIYDRSVTARIDKERGVSIDNQLQADFSHGRFQHTALAGLSYTDQKFTREQSRGTAPPLDAFDPDYGGAPVNVTPLFTRDTDSSQLGLYAQDHVKYADRWVMLVGGRFDDFDSDQVTQGANGASATTDTDDSAFTYRVGAIRLFDNGMGSYASYTESFQPATGADVRGNAFDPTTGQQYELGVKYEPVGVNASITLAAYELTQQNVTTADLANPDFSVQTGEVRSRGVEFEARASLAERVDISAAYSYTDAEITKSNDGTVGNRLFSVPKQQASLWAQYHFTRDLFDGLSLGGGVRYIGDTVSLNEEFDVPSYTVFDAMASYEINAWLFQLNIDNILNKEYLAGCVFSCLYGQERTATVSAAYRW